MRNWKYTINVKPFINESEDPKDLIIAANGIAGAIKNFIETNPTAFDSYDMNQLQDIVDYLTDCDDLDEINYQLDTLYDFGDDFNIWINNI